MKLEQAAGRGPLVDYMRKAEREGKPRERVKFLGRYSLLILDKIGYPTLGSGGSNLIFQLVNACYERSAMIMTSNPGFGEWAEIFGDAVVVTALLNSLRSRRQGLTLADNP